MLMQRLFPLVSELSDCSHHLLPQGYRSLPPIEQKATSLEAATFEFESTQLPGSLQELNRL
jgi:hypothetical protein